MCEIFSALCVCVCAHLLVISCSLFVVFQSVGMGLLPNDSIFVVDDVWDDEMHLSQLRLFPLQIMDRVLQLLKMRATSPRTIIRVVQGEECIWSFSPYLCPSTGANSLCLSFVSS